MRVVDKIMRIMFIFGMMGFLIVFTIDKDSSSGLLYLGTAAGVVLIVSFIYFLLRGEYYKENKNGSALITTFENIDSGEIEEKYRIIKKILGYLNM